MRLAFALVVVAMPGTASAQPITDREYAIELYEGIAIGDSVQTSMGGAGAARILGSAGALINPSAPAVRRSTDNDSWSWDYHLDYLTGQFSSDYDNNGVVVDEGSGAQLATFGLALRFGKWAGAVTLTAQNAPIEGAVPALDAETTRVKFVLARFIESWDLSIGFGTQTVRFAISGPQELFAMTGTGAVIGTTWLPRRQNYRAAIALESRILDNRVETKECDPMSCQGFILPEDIESPGRTIVGFAYRWATTPWNQQVTTRFRDERSVTLATDLVFAGSSSRGNGIEAFGMQQLQPVGRAITVSPRAGVEVEALPGRLRLRAGSYWEPGRYDDIGGRLHGTFGFEVRALEFKLWGIRRGRVGATFDIASRYRNVGLSVGFWH